MDREDDQTLVHQCLKGNRGAFETIVEKYHKTVFNIAFRILNDGEDAADVTQSVFLRAYEHLSGFSPRYKFFSWLYKIAVNVSLNALKQRRDLPSLNEEMVSGGKSPEDVYNDSELREKIQEALMKLGIDYRVVVVLSYFQDLSYNEIAYVLEIPEKTVKSRLFTARRMLRDILMREGV
jgi:RNA polymerase sigma-70 factor (ECF subfamily)